MLFKKLEQIDDRYREIEQRMTLPEVVSNAKEYSALIKEYKSIEPIIEKYREYKENEKNMRESDEMMRDSALEPELRLMAQDEFRLARELCDKNTEELKILLSPKDPNDERNVVIEIRQGAGGEEAVLTFTECTVCTRIAAALKSSRCRKTKPSLAASRKSPST